MPLSRYACRLIKVGPNIQLLSLFRAAELAILTAVEISPAAPANSQCLLDRRQPADDFTTNTTHNAIDRLSAATLRRRHHQLLSQPQYATRLCRRRLATRHSLLPSLT
jgi:hypothetical protein